MKMNSKGEYPHNIIMDAYTYVSEWNSSVIRPTGYTDESVDKALKEILRVTKRDHQVVERGLNEIQMFYRDHKRITEIAMKVNRSATTINRDFRIIFRELIQNIAVRTILENTEIPKITLDTSIIDTELSHHVMFALHRAFRYKFGHSPTIGDILNMELWELTRVRNIGCKGLKELSDYMTKLGYSLKECPVSGVICFTDSCPYKYEKSCKTRRNKK